MIGCPNVISAYDWLVYWSWYTRNASINIHNCFLLQRYLISFRVHELKELLRSIGCSQRGRKNELFQRSNELLQHGSPKIQNKIREIYERSHYTKRSHFSHRTYRYSPTKPAASPAHSYIVHPDVTYKPHPFFQQVDSIIRPTALCKYVIFVHSSLRRSFSTKTSYTLIPNLSVVPDCSPDFWSHNAATKGAVRERT